MYWLASSCWSLIMFFDNQRPQTGLCTFHKQSRVYIHAQRAQIIPMIFFSWFQMNSLCYLFSQPHTYFTVFTISDEQNTWFLTLPALKPHHIMQPSSHLTPYLPSAVRKGIIDVAYHSFPPIGSFCHLTTIPVLKIKKLKVKWSQ